MMPTLSTVLPRRSRAGLVTLAALLSAAAPAPATVAPASLVSVEVSAPADALTFARTASGPTRSVIMVVRHRGGSIEGVDLSVLLGRPVDDPIAVFLDLGYDALRDALLRAPAHAHVTVPLRQLVTPVDLRDRHIAAGTNYPEHAGESGVEDGPFLFPKLVAPTAPFDPVFAGHALLDYEVELAWVPLEPLAEGARPRWMGLILCNDFTDRDTLLRKVDVWNVESGDGFTTGKSFPGYLPVGTLFVIPRDFRRFAADLELRLDVDGEPRQRSLVSAAVWDVDELLDAIWARRGSRWKHRGGYVSLLGSSETIADRTLIMSGTPSGTVFQGIGFGHRLSGVGAWLFGGWTTPVAHHVVDAYVRHERRAGRYLQPGQRVTIHVARLGVIDTEVVR